MKKQNIILILLLFLLIPSAFTQNKVSVGILGDKFSDFTLNSLQGDQISTADLRGKNVLIIVSRGKYKDNAWCTLCSYQYQELADLELNNQLKEKYNLEILFLLPYVKDSVKKWVDRFPEDMKLVEQWKNPSNLETISQGQKDWMEFTREHYPKSFDFTDKKVPLPFPILIDDAQEVSKGLDLSRTDWGGTQTLQNIPAVFLIDKDGILRFKYISQSTIDRPSAEYIQSVLQKML